MINDFRFVNMSYYMRNMIKAIGSAWPFIKRNKLWAGLLEHKWIAVFMFFVSTFFSYYILSSWGWIGGDSTDVNIISKSDLGVELSEDMKNEGKSALFSGGTKYLLMIVFEVIIFHFAVKTFDLLSGQKRITTLSDFIQAEKRMIIVMVRNFLKGLAVHGVLYVSLSILGYEFMTGFIMFFIYAYFLGYAFIDNYNEQFNKTIKQSEFIIRQHFWASITLGVLASGMLIVPLLGPLVAPIFCAISATIYGHKYIGLAVADI